MAHIEGEVLIHRPVEQVFDFVADERTEPTYNRNMTAAEKITDGPIGVGTRFRSTIRSRPRPLHMVVEYTGFDRPHLIASTTHSAAAEFSGTRTFTPIPAGTRLRWSWDARPKGATRLLAPVLAPIGARQERRMWTTLRDHLEAGAPARPPGITTVPTSAAPAGSRRPRFGLRRRPGRLAAGLFRLPLKAYQHNAGPAVGRTFLAFTHVGRATGRPHRTVAMVLRYATAAREAVIVSAWGPQTDWYRNLQAHPAVQVQLGGQTFPPRQRFLTEEEAIEVAGRFRREHPHRLRFFSVLGWGDLTDDERLRQFVRTHPFVAFRPADAPGAHAER
ncbi:MAG TPA: nitroreductase family deazaflavin-dependent oxidoreductase [Blastococcus sp.]|jgi:deazaflavin-dependent oxidoreductase (nitroreductase family)|nr:nitroreductase family deazaflavin-dependent oxidoreductase [Blastococcus sp.]